MRRLKSSRNCNDPFFLGCIYLCLLSAVHGYLLEPDYLNDLKETEIFDDGGIPHKSTTGRELEGGPKEDVDGGIDDGIMGLTNGGSRGHVRFAEVPPKFIEARKFGKVLLECSATGTPAPEIKWYKDGKPLHKDTKYKKKMLSHHGHPFFRYGKQHLQSQPNLAESLGQTKSKVSLDCLTKADAGIYECVISNGHEKESATTEVRVASFQKTGCHRRNPLQDAAIIHQWSETYMQTIGDDALLICRAAGPHETYWLGPTDEPVETKSGKYQMTEQGDLVVRDLSFEDMGMFKCLVKNMNGQDMIQTFVYPLASS